MQKGKKVRIRKKISRLFMMFILFGVKVIELDLKINTIEW